MSFQERIYERRVHCLGGVARHIGAAQALALALAGVFAFSGSSYAQLKTARHEGLVIGQTKPLASTPTPFTTAAEQCIVPAANFHGLNPWLLRTVLRVESSLKPDAIGRNKNGTYDIGIGQINSMHLPELRKFGIEPGHLADACVGTYVSGWFLKKAIAERGYTWEGVASYHSKTPEFNQRYQRLLVAELQKSQAVTPSSALMPTPMKSKRKPEDMSNNPFFLVSPRHESLQTIDQNIVVFDSHLEK